MSIQINLLAAEMQRYVVQNKKVVLADFARALTVPVDNHCKKVTKIKGTYQVLNSIMTHVVQGFKPQWQALGEFHVKDKEIKNYQQKVNFPFVPADVLGTFLAEWYEEDKKPTDKEIAKRIYEWLLIQITDDVSLLSMIGRISSLPGESADGQFGFSIKGWNQIVEELLVNTTHPCYKIPLNIFTGSNIVEEIQKFELAFPKLFKSKIKQIHLSEKNKELYEIDYFNTFGSYPSFKDEDKTKSPLRKRELVGHDDMADNIIFATVDGNMLNLIDVIDNPATFTDVQVQDYTVKVFGEFWKGWDFLINEAVVVGDFSGSEIGLGDADLMELYYPHEEIN